MSNRFLAQAPALNDEEVLFATRPTFVANLEAIADHIARPALADRRSPPMTFGLYGAWGMGKSTALNALDNLLTERFGQYVRYTSSRYEASLWQFAGDARSSISYSILEGLSAEVPGLLAASLVGLRDQQISPSGLPPSQLADALAFRAALSRLSDAPPLLEPWMRDLTSTTAQASDGKPTVHVVFIDDLDRCTEEFTTNVLAATTYWTSTRQEDIFFVLAASREHLIRSLERNLPLGEQYPDQALEKYIHVAVQVPTLLDNVQEVHTFLTDLVRSIEVDDAEDAERTLELTAIFEEGLSRYPNCAVAPLLRVDGKLSPRSAKQRLNTFLAEFRPTKPVTEEDVKIWTIKALWPDFWWQRYWRTQVTDDVEQVEWLQRLQRVGSAMHGLWDIGVQELGPVFEHLARLNSLDTAAIDPTLAIYLSSRPIITSPLGKSGRLTQTASEDGPNESHATEVAETGLDDKRSQLLLLRIRLKRHADSGERSKALNDINEILSLVQREDFSDDPGAVGNIAITAEDVSEQAALELHRRAHFLDPTHENIAQNFVQYILELKSTGDYGLASSILDSINQPVNAMRSNTLKMRVRIARGEDVPKAERMVVLEPYLKQLRDEPSGRNIVSLSSQAGRVGINAATTFPVEYEQAARSAAGAEDVAAIVESYANGLPSSDARRAVDAYRFILDSGVACVAGSDTDRFRRVTSNLAVALQNANYTAAAARVLLDLYRRDSSRASTVRSLASALFTLGKGSIAEAVISRQRVDEVLEDGLPYDLPPLAGADDNAWWRSLVVSKLPPCDNVFERSL